MVRARARPSAAAGEATWQWQNHYRVWDASRRLFVTPENWIDPEPRLPPRVQAMLADVVDSVVPDRQDAPHGRRAAEASTQGPRVLFSGGSSATALASARVVASGLGRDLYRIDTRAVASKYAGETEDNLRRVLASADERTAVLFFDEADTLFTRRTPLEAGRGQSAGLDAGTLLRQVASHKGVVICAVRHRPNTASATQFQRVVSVQPRSRAARPKRP